MYFLKKLTSFGRNANAGGAAADNSSTCDAQCSSQTGMENESPEIVENDKVSDVDIEQNISSSSSLSIPDCFFDDVPETPSSDNMEIASSEDTDSREEGASADRSGDKRENVESSTYNSIRAIIVDESPQKPKETADGAVFFIEDNIESERVEKAGTDEIGEGYNDIGWKETFDPAEVGSAEAKQLEICPSPEKWGDIQSDKEGFSVENLSDLITLFGDNNNSVEQPTRSQLRNDDDDNIDESFDIDDEYDNNDEDSYFNILGSDYIEEFLDKENDKAEARLAARRQARVEAREIRLRELERQQKEQEENADRAFDMSYMGDTILRTGRVTPSGTSLNARDRSMATVNSYHSSRRSSEDSIEEGLTLRDIRHELKEAEEKFKKAMIANAQLDNEKSALAYQVELLKDRFEDLEETHAQLTREHRDKCREHEQLKRAAVKLKEDVEYYKMNLLERDKLIAEYGLVIVDTDEDSEGKPTRTLVSTQSAELLQQAGTGSLDVRLKKFSEERNELLDEIRHLKLELEEERSKRIPDSKAGYGSITNGPLDEETSKTLSDYKFKLQKAEQDVSTLQANVARLESQVIRYKTAAESSEKAEDELKIEKRKLQRENRESIARIEELETANSHLQRRMDKLKNAKSTLLKEL